MLRKGQIIVRNQEYEAVLLHELIKPANTKRQHRSLALLKRPGVPSPPHWHAYLPRGFDAALDIAKTEKVFRPLTEEEKEEERKKKAKSGDRPNAVKVWTQGTSFSFQAGDIIYDSPDAYEVWADALKKFSWQLDVVSARPVLGPEPKTKSTPASPRTPGYVEIAVRVPNEARDGLTTLASVEVTQDELVRFVVLGDCPTIAEVLEAPKIPNDKQPEQGELY